MDLADEAEEEYRTEGTKATWHIPDIATVVASVSHETVYVADEGALTRWVATRYPSEVEEVLQIRPAWLAGFLERLEVEHNTIDAARSPLDPGTGEWPPGLAVRPGGVFGGISIRPTKEAKMVFGALAEHGLKRLAVEAGPAVPTVLAEIGAPDGQA